MASFKSKQAFTLAVSLLVGSTSVGCGDVAPIPTDAVVIQYDTGVQTLCRDCASIGGYYVKNLRDKPYRATVEESHNDSMDSRLNEKKERRFKLDAFERKYLGCTPVKSIGGFSCSVNISWKVKTQSSVASLDGPSRGRTASLMIGVGEGSRLLDSSVFFDNVVKNADWATRPAAELALPLDESAADAPPADPAAPPPNVNCKRECLDPTRADEGNCYALPKKIAGDKYRAPLGKFVKWVSRTRNGTMKKTEIMTAFGVSEDPCERSDTRIVRGTLFNEGKRCILDYALPTGIPNKDIEMSFYMPEKIEGTVATSGPATTATFRDRAKAPALRFKRPGIDQDFGGSIRVMDRVPEHLVVTTDTGCLDLPL